MNPKVYVILLNYNGWQDTVACIESLFKLSYDNYQIVLSDNASTDSSVSEILSWAESNIFPSVDIPKDLSDRVFPLSSKPVNIRVLSRDEALGDPKEANIRNESVILIRNDRNEGFAEGNNLALQFAQKMGDGDFVWLLNTDTLAHPESLTALVEAAISNPNAGMLGSKTLLYEKPDTIYTMAGGTLNKKFDTHWIGYGESAHLSIQEKPDYISGSSCFMSIKVLQEVGLMRNEYFMYYEDVDWSLRVVQKGYDLLCIDKSIIWHRYEKSTSKSKYFFVGKRQIDYPLIRESLVGYYYSPRNKVYLIKKNFKDRYVLFLIRLLIPQFIRRFVLILLFQDYKRIRMALLWRAFWDAQRDRMGQSISLKEWKDRWSVK